MPHAPATARPPLRGPLLGLAAAALFGASAPVAKLLVPGSGPFALAGLLYLGAGLGLALSAPLRRRGVEAPLRRADLPALAGVILTGGVAGPVLLVLGLARLSGATASLLLNLETPFTIGLAVLALRERLSPREAAGAGAVVLGAAALTWLPGAGGLAVDGVGAAAIAGACAAWAVDNALSQRLAIRDPGAVVRTKAFAAGAVDLVVAWALGERFPSAAHAGAALATGALGYGLSLVLHLRAVRALGAARQAALFGTAPFLGALLAVPLLGDRLPLAHLVAGAVMALGVAAIAGARHAHPHAHEPLEHEHAHVHDEHHAHAHEPGTAEPHSHVHRHEGILHDHPHAPDVHHRHGH